MKREILKVKFGQDYLENDLFRISKITIPECSLSIEQDIHVLDYERLIIERQGDHVVAFVEWKEGVTSPCDYVHF